MTNADQYRQGASALIFKDGGKEKEILLVQLHLYKDNEWNLPGGGSEPGENPIENASREVFEELGITSSNLELTGVSSEKFKYDFPEDFVNKRQLGYKGQEKSIVVFRYKGDGQYKLQKDEVRKYLWVSISKLENYLIYAEQLNTTNFVIDEFHLSI